MMSQTKRTVLISFAAAATLLAMPAQSKALGCLDWLCGGLFGGWGQTTYRAPFLPQTCAPAATPSACVGTAPQTCCYVPQTSYRTVYRRVPVTTCVASTRWSFWYGSPITVYRPVTNWISQPTLVPYTTYRVVCSDPCATYGAGLGYPVGTVTSGCSCATPAISSQPVPYSLPSSSEPLLNGTSEQKTYEENSQPETQERLKPIPNPETSSKSTPEIIDPGNRTTSRSIRQAAHLRLISSPQKPVSPPSTSRVIGVWRAASD